MAMFVMPRMPATFLAAYLAGRYSGLELRSQHPPIQVGLASRHFPGRDADSSAIQVEADAPAQLMNLLLAQAGIGAHRTAFCTAEAGFHASGNGIQIAG